LIRLQVLLRYSTCGGLTNQHYSHIAGLTLGVSLGARIIMPPALRRTSFAHYFSTDPSKNQVKWSAGPQEDLWDTEALQKYWKGEPCLALSWLLPPALTLLQRCCEG
jgi:hypothetical protein